MSSFPGGMYGGPSQSPARGGLPDTAKGSKDTRDRNVVPPPP
jgi:hypothetical protein